MSDIFEPFCLAHTLDYIVMQMRKTNLMFFARCEKGCQGTTGTKSMNITETLAMR